VAPCLEGAGELRVWTANTDREAEGVWSDRYTGRLLDHAPWPPDRPYDGGTAYNCMMLEVAAGPGHPAQVTVGPGAAVGDKAERIYYGAEMSADAMVYDEECSVRAGRTDGPGGVLRPVRGGRSRPQGLGPRPLPLLPVRPDLHIHH
jgi:hypothetical protein